MEERNDLLKRLQNSKDLAELSNYICNIDGSSSDSLSEHLKQLMKEKNINASELIKRSRIERTYCYQILNGRKKQGRDKIIAIALALSLSVDETQRVLRIAKEGDLYAKDKRDCILIFALNHKYNLLDTNQLLTHYDEEELR
ncbi:MAG: helix-turn-helix transcriptional regulator [Clostridiales bacterium]|nr:helix-turn-helix transcriptional regulator [Clostridiales bacterium]